ncbi:hypothetical protein Tco_0774835 [Tanacetum coccineum]|uniref:Uncharacterized protein n=1 Tax=Tanacetum coccineum TaxID=301880 RepID=A0ABQ4ZPP0_9ASTR
MKTPMSSDMKLTKDEECESVDSTKYRGMIDAKDYGTKRGRHSTSESSSTFDNPSSSHRVDDDNDEDDEGTSRVSTPFPTHFINSLSNDVPQVFTNPPPDEQNL